MGTQTLGIDIADSSLSGVVLDRQRRATQLVDWCSLPLRQGEDVSTSIGRLCEQLGWQGECSFLGLPLSLLSVRNLALPFTDVKKITQALPCELEEQLATPLEQVSYDFCLGRKNGSESALLVFAVERQWLGHVLEGARACIDPDGVLPAMVPLAEQAAAVYQESGPLLLVHGDLHSLDIALITDGTPVFYRRLSYPEQLLIQPPFILENDRVTAILPEAEEGIGRLARLVEQSLHFFRMESRDATPPKQVLLTGPLAGMEDALIDSMAAALAIPVKRLSLLEHCRVICSSEQRSRWNSPQMDRALAVALSGGKKGGTINLRQGHLAPQKSLLSQRRRVFVPALAALGLLVAGLGYFGATTYGLQQRDTALRQEMTAIFQATFPGVTRIQDPYVEMQAKLKSLQGTETPMPFFVTDAWVIPLLADISRRIPASIPLKVGRLSMDREGVVMRGTTETFNGVESIKSALVGSPRLRNVQIVSATAEKGKDVGLIRFEMQMQLEGM
jgi:general secretion pathway protein L